jgi:hypothetical protein
MRAWRPLCWILVLGAAVLAGPVSAASAGDLSITEDPTLLGIAITQSGIIAGHLGIPLKFKLAVGYADDPADVANLATRITNKVNGDFDRNGPYCQIAVNKAYLDKWPQPTAKQELIAHEVFHCFQHQIAPDMYTVNGDKDESSWIIEGLARWVDLSLYPTDPVPDLYAWVPRYVDTSTRQLFTRSYDAVGFWGHVQDVTGDLWQRIPAILKSGADLKDGLAFNAAVGSHETSIMNSWGSSVFNLPGASEPWTETSPLAGSPVYPPGEPKKISATAGVVLKPYTTAQLQIEPRADEPLIQISLGHGTYGRFGVTENYVDSQLSGKVFCAGSGCTSPAASCPGGWSSTLPKLTPLPAQPLLGVATAQFTGDVAVSYSSAQNSSHCTPPKGSQTHAASSGDPHMISFGQNDFGFQTTGEFTLVKSTKADDFEVQARQQPVTNSHTVSRDTAVAIREDHSIIELDLGPKGGFELRVDRHLSHDHSARLSGDGSLSIVTGHGPVPPVTATVRWHDGTTVSVETVDGYRLWMSVSISLAQDRVGHVNGLLGESGQSPSHEFVSRTGGHYDTGAITNGEFYPPDGQILYDEYGASWRITQKESLFTYTDHKDTNSYTTKGFPAQTFSLGTQPAATQAAATTTCAAAGITDPALLNDCEYDVVVTKDKRFVTGDAILQKVTGPGPPHASGGPGPSPSPGSGPSPAPPLPPPPPPNPGTVLGAGAATPSIAYDPASGDTYVAWLDPTSSDVVDLCVVAAGSGACNAGAGPYRLTDPAASAGGASPAYFAAQVLVAPGGVVVVANVEGAANAVLPATYTSTNGAIAWSSAAGGAGFAAPAQGIATGGKLLAEAAGAGEMPAGGAVALSTGAILTYGNENPFGSGATDFTLTAPAPKATPIVDPGAAFSDDEFSNSARIAATPDPAHPGQFIVVAVGTDGGGCLAGTADTTGFGVVDGTPAALRSATWPAFTTIVCDANGPVLTGGSAIGVVQAEGAGLSGAGADGVYWRAFDIATDSFGAPVPISDETAQTVNGPVGLAAATDASAGLYASWLDARGVVVAYSPTAGASWPSVVATGIASGDDVVAGLGAGHAEVAYTYGAHEYLDAVG